MATQIRVTTQDDSRVVYLDLSDSQPMTANYQFKDIQDFKSNKGNHTFNFRIPSTPNNDLFFGDYFEVTQFGNYNPKIKVEATISKDTIDVFEGYLQLTNVFVSNDVTHHYECVVFSSVASLGQVLQGKYLAEFDWTSYNHNVSLNTITTSMNRASTPLLSGDIVYSMYDYTGGMFGGGSNGSMANEETPYSVLNLRPQIRVNKVFSQILNESGYTYESTFIDTDLNDLYMDLNSGTEAIQTDLDTSNYNVNIGTSGTQTFPASIGMHTIVYNNASGNNYTNSSGNYNETTGLYTPSDLWTSYGLIEISATLDQPVGLTAYLQLILWDVTSDEIAMQMNGTTNIADGQTMSISTFGEFGYPLNVEHEYEIRIRVLSSSDETATITIQSGNVEFAPTPSLLSVNVEGLELPTIGFLVCDVSRNFAKIKALDFITSLATKFNLVIIPDEQTPTHLHIQPYKDWIDGGNEVDWTEKLDVSKDVQLKPTVDLQAKSLIFSDDKSADFMNALFQQQSGKVYGSQYVDNTENDFGKDKEEIKTIFKPTITSYINETGLRSCVCTDADGKNENAIRLSFYCGYGGSDVVGQSFWLTDSFLSTTTTEFTSFSIFQNYEDAVVTPSTKCLSFMGETTGALGYPVPLNGAYSVYWKRFLEETYSREARILTGTFFLSALDIQTMNFNDIVFVKNEYFRINKISNYPLVGSGSCNVELVKVERVNVIDAVGNQCLMEDSTIGANGVVNFISTTNGSAVTPSQSCCEAFGYTYISGKCMSEMATPNNPTEPMPDTNVGSFKSIGSNNSSSGFGNIILGNNNLSTGFNFIKGNRNLVETSSDYSTISGNNNSVRAGVSSNKILGDSNILNPYSLNWTGASYEVYSRQAFKNNSIVGDYGIALGNGDSFISGGADELYNTVGRSGSGHFVKHGFTDDEEVIYIGQNGMFTFGTDFYNDQATNCFRLEFPSMISFEINVVGHDRGTTQSRSQEYSFRKYSGTIINTNNSGSVSIKDFTLDTQKESANFNNYTFDLTPAYSVTDRPVGGGDLVYIDDGMFYMYISTLGAIKLDTVDWTIDFRYTLVGLQNIGRTSGQPIFTPTQISGCLLWVDAADSTTITHSSGSVSQWDDKSGNDYHLTQSTAAYEPTYSSVAPYPYIEFDGNNQVLGNTDAGLIGVSDGRNTMFVVFESANTTTSSPGQTLVAVNERGRQYYGMNINSTTAGAGGTAFMNKSTQDYSCNNSTIPSTTKQVVIGTRNATDRIIYDQDGVTDTKTNSTNTSQDMFSIGATWETGRTPTADYTGKIYEVIVYDAVLTTEERNQVQNYLQTKWNT